MSKLQDASDSANVAPPSLTTRSIDFWMLGGASLVLWAAMFLLEGTGRTGWAVNHHFGNLAAMSGSLALLADAGHMASDTAGFALAWFAFRIARRRADSQRNCGFDRFQILIAFVNGAMLLIIAVWIVIEAATRTFEPTEVLGTPILVALIIIRSAWALIKASTHILLEGTPDGIDTHEIRADLEAEIAAVSDIHHVHAWSINNTRPMVTQHARTDETGAPDTVTAAIKARLLEKFGIAHATVEIEHETCADAAPR